MTTCCCAHNSDGSTTTYLCPTHAHVDPCLTMASVTGKRRKGTILRGVCTNCGHGGSAFGSSVQYNGATIALSQTFASPFMVVKVDDIIVRVHRNGSVRTEAWWDTLVEPLLDDDDWLHAVYCLQHPNTLQNYDMKGN